MKLCLPKSLKIIMKVSTDEDDEGDNDDDDVFNCFLRGYVSPVIYML